MLLGQPFYFTEFRRLCPFEFNGGVHFSFWMRNIIWILHTTAFTYSSIHIQLHPYTTTFPIQHTLPYTILLLVWGVADSTCQAKPYFYSGTLRVRAHIRTWTPSPGNQSLSSYMPVLRITAKKKNASNHFVVVNENSESLFHVEGQVWILTPAPVTWYFGKIFFFPKRL